jgi:hypothetical protein
MDKETAASSARRGGPLNNNELQHCQVNELGDSESLAVVTFINSFVYFIFYYYFIKLCS